MGDSAHTMALNLMVAALLLTCTAIVAAGEKRYVVESKSPRGWPVWTSRSFAESCGRALMSRSKEAIQEFCEEGFAGLKPKVGYVTTGDEVELLDAGDCGRIMVYVRVLTGPVKGEVGCIPSSALSSFKPE